MHRDASGRLHLSVIFFGAWSQALWRTMECFHHLLPVHVPRSPMRRIEHGEAWFHHFQCLLPARPERGRPEPIQLHVSSKTGTLVAHETDRLLLERADAVMFVADMVRMRIEATLEYRAFLDEWSNAFVLTAFQLDDWKYTSVEYTNEAGERVREEPAVRLDEAELRRVLRIADRPTIVTKAHANEGIGDMMRLLLELVVPPAMRGELRTLPLLAPIESL